MNNPYNKLTDAEAERLAILSEELAEGIKVIGKILRHGYDGSDPTGKEQGTNREQLATEIGQIYAEAEEMIKHKDLSEEHLTRSVEKRMEKIFAKTYRHHQ